MTYDYKLKPITFYVDSQLYKSYEIQAQKQSCKISDLILNAMNCYANKNFSSKRSLKDIDFSRTVTLRKNATDFLFDDEYKY